MSSRALKRRHGTRNTRRYLPLLYILAIVSALALGTFCSVFVLGESWLKDLPQYEDSSSYNLAQKTRVYASDNTTLLAEFYLEDREPVSSLDSINEYVVHGTVATEDERFYSHDGVDVMGIARALVNNLAGGEMEGASTITQQFVRNTVLSDEAGEQTIKRKVREAYIALKLEEIYSKDDILLLYLNTVNYGSGAYGIQTAAHRYFNTDCDNLTLAQAATLVGIPQSPTYNNPIDYPDNCLQRRNVVLSRMLTNGYITQDEYDSAVKEPLVLNVNSETSKQGIFAYEYFTSYVRQVLLEKYSEAEVFKGGLTVTTTLDIDVQKQAEAACKQKESEIDGDLEVALVAVDPDTGFIEAIVGGKDYYADQYNLATQATRSPGSSFKTFTLAAAVENGINPQQNVNCSSPITIGDWDIENYNGVSYGTRSIASAFYVSSNTGFARLSETITPEKVAEMAQRLGVNTPLVGYQSITLGSEAVTVKDMACAYATIAAGGIKREGTPIARIVDASGETIYEADTTGERVIDEKVAHAVEQVMEGVITSGTGTAARLNNGQVAGGKTGTTENFRDSYFVGITPQYSVAIWLGAREERTMSSNFTAASTFEYFLDPLIGDKLEDFVMKDAGEPEYRALTNEELTTLTGAMGSSSSTYGYNYGYNNGYNNGYNYNSGYGNGYNYGYNSGYGNGYN